MKSKILSLFLLTAILSLILVSATITITSPVLSKTGNSVTIKITSTVNDTISFSNPVTIIQDTKSITFTKPADIILIAGTETPIVVNYTIDSGFDFEIGESYSTNFTATGPLSVPATVTQTLTFEKSFCSLDNKAELDITNLEIDTLDGYGDDESFWYPLDKVELSFDAENKGDWDVRDIEIQICVFDEKSKKCVFDEDDFDISDDKFNIDYNDDEVTVTATLDVDPDKLTAGNTDYTIYIKAEGQTDDSDAGTEDEKFNCISSSTDIKIRTDEAFVIFSDITFSEDTLQCGSEATLDFEVWNVGDEDLNDDEVFVNVYNKVLGIDKDITFSKGIDKMDKVDASISFNVPQDVKEGTYELLLKAYDDDRYSDSDAYQNKEDDPSEIDAFFTVKGNCGSSATTLSVQFVPQPELDSTTPEAIAGKQVIVRVTLKNTGTATITPIVSISGNSIWSSLKAIDPQTLVLNAGESKTADILLNIDADAEGEKEFTITATYGNKTTEQKVLLSIAGTSAGITGSVIGEHLRANWFIYTIVLINIILIIAIIAVVKSMVGRSSSL